MMRGALLVAAFGAASAAVTANNFVSYQSGITPSGEVSISTSGTTQTITYSMSGLGTSCLAQPSNSIANACYIKIYPATKCSAYTATAGVASTETGYYTGIVQASPYTTSQQYSVSSSGGASSSMSINTGATEYDIIGKTIIFHDGTGTMLTCATIGAPEYLSRLAHVPRVTKDNCANIEAISKGTMKAAPSIDATKPGLSPVDALNALRHTPLLNLANCKSSFPDYTTTMHSTFVNDKHMNTPKGAKGPGR